jgi:hypothetical protein
MPNQSKWDPELILRSWSTTAACHKLTDLALEFAVLDYLDTSRSLISLLNEHSPSFHVRVMYPKSLWLAWDISSWPEGEKSHVNETLHELAEKIL